MSYFSHRSDLPLLQIEDRRAIDRGAEPRRESLRQKTLLRGYIVLPQSETATAVAVRNLSTGGAKLEFSAPEHFARSGVLLIPTRQAAYRYQLIWTDALLAGVTFSQPVDLVTDKKLAAILASVAP